MEEQRRYICHHPTADLNEISSLRIFRSQAIKQFDLEVLGVASSLI